MMGGDKLEDLKDIIAENLTTLRSKLGLTQMELAQKLNYSDKSVSKWERAESVPDIYILKEMADIFGVDVNYLITKHKNPRPRKQFSHKTVMMIVLIGIYVAALIAFIALWICKIIYWRVFIYALPVSIIALLSLNSVLEKGKHNYYIVSALVLSLIITLYFIFYERNWWQLFLLIVPAELLVFLSFRVIRKR